MKRSRSQPNSHRRKHSQPPALINEWQDLIQQVVADKASNSESEVLQSGVIDGQVLLTSGAPRMGVGRNVARSIVMVGDGNRIQVTLNDDEMEKVRRRVFPKVAGLPPPFPSVLFVGRAKELEGVRAYLTRSNRSHPLILRGTAGIGKTSLVSAIGRDRRILKCFPDGVLWTSLGQRPELLGVLSAWGSALGTDKVRKAFTIKAAAEQLLVLLAAKKMLLLVDDVWDPADLAPFVAARGAECSLVSTTRLPQVADSFTASQAQVEKLDVLTHTYAFALFEAISPEIARRYSRECKELLRDLEYLPLSIHVAARLLAAESRYDWGVAQLIEELKNSSALLPETSPDDRLGMGESLTVAALLKKSTDLLTDAAKDYYSYLGHFAPKPAAFDLKMLKHVWDVKDPKPIIRELANHGLLEPLGAGQFQMHALLVAHAKSLLT